MDNMSTQSQYRKSAIKRMGRLIVICCVIYTVVSIALHSPSVRNLAATLIPVGVEVWITKEKESLTLDQVAFGGQPLVFENGTAIVRVSPGIKIISYLSGNQAFADTVTVSGPDMYITIGNNGLVK